jgi:hypothetical protein
MEDVKDPGHEVHVRPHHVAIEVGALPSPYTYPTLITGHTQLF